MIEVGRNSIVVRNIDTGSAEFKKAQSIFSLYDKVQFKYTFNVYTIIDNDMYFPTTVTSMALQQIFPKKDITFNYKTTSKSRKIEYVMKNQPRNELQKSALEFLLKMKRDADNRSRFLSLETGSGKTYITINAISQFKKCAMIIIDTLDLAEQWKREFLNHTNLKDSDIEILSGKDSVDKAIKSPSAKVYIALHRTLGNLLSEDRNALNSLMNKLQIGVRVFDESHVNFGNICKINSLSNVEYTIYLTATPSRSNFNDNSLYGKVFKNVPYFNGKELSAEKYHTVVLYHMNSHPDLDTKLSVRTKYGFSAAKWSSYIEEEGFQNFLETVEEIFEKFSLEKRGKKVAIMLPTINLIKKLKSNLEITHPDLEIGEFIGEIKKNQRIKELSKRVILTNDKIFDKGIDVSDLEILINFVPFGSIVKTEQIIGRLRYHEGMSSVLIDVTDNGFDECVKQFKLRRRFYKKKAKKIIEIKN